MTDRFAGFVVVLDEDVREDDAQATINAIKQIKGVLSVDPVFADITMVTARARARGELVARIGKVLGEHYV